MRAKFIKYGRGVKRDTGNEYLEISIDIQPGEFEEDALTRAKKFVQAGLRVNEHVEKTEFNSLRDALNVKIPKEV